MDAEVKHVMSSALEKLVEDMPLTTVAIVENNYFITQIEHDNKRMILMDFTKQMPADAYQLQQQSIQLYQEFNNGYTYWVL